MIGSLLLPVLIPLLKIMHSFHLVDHPDRGNRSRRSEGDCLLAQWVIFGPHYFALQALWQFLQHFLRWFLGLIYLINRGTNLTSQFIPIWRSLTQACLVSKAFRRARRKRKKTLRFYVTQIVHSNGKILRFPWRNNCLSQFLEYIIISKRLLASCDFRLYMPQTFYRDCNLTSCLI